jgi:hypothetical protein
MLGVGYRLPLNDRKFASADAHGFPTDTEQGLCQIIGQRAKRGHERVINSDVFHPFIVSQSDENGVARCSNLGHPAPKSGVSVWYVSTIDALPEPIQNFILNPSHPVGAKLYPFRELAGCLQTRDMLWRIKHCLPQLPFR